MADFLGVKVEEQLLKEIAEKGEFRKLKEADEYVRKDQTMSEIMKVIDLNEKPTVYRKGKKKNKMCLYNTKLMSSIVANSKDGQDQKDKYLDTSRKIMSQELLNSLFKSYLQR